MTDGGRDRTMIVRLWMEAREIEGLSGELRSSLAVVGEDKRVNGNGLDHTRKIADLLVVRLARELGAIPTTAERRGQG